MDTFLSEANTRLEQHTINLAESQSLFITTLHFFKYQPKTGQLVDCTPGQFLEHWAQFCSDFHEVWKKQIAAHYQE